LVILTKCEYFKKQYISNDIIYKSAPRFEVIFENLDVFTFAVERVCVLDNLITVPHETCGDKKSS